MNIDNIIREMRQDLDFNLKDIAKMVNILVGTFTDFLKNKDEIEIRGLGSFKVKKRKGRRAQLRTKVINSPEHYGILFNDSLKLRKELNNKRED